MAEVFRAELIGAEGFCRPVAVKRMLPALSAEPGFEEMFRKEAQLAAGLHHPNVVTVLDFDRDAEGQLFLVMELVEGTDLRRLMNAGPLPPAVAAHVVAEVLEALQHAHTLTVNGRACGLVHRDVTPHNVLIGREGHVKLSDFGIAKAVEGTSMTATGVLKGKVAYMSPEQIEGEPLDGRSDIFALGIVFHELLTGRSLFRGDSLPDRVVLNRILALPLERPPGAPDALVDVCLRMLERDRDARYPDAQAALTDLLASGHVSPRGALDLRALVEARAPSAAAQVDRDGAADTRLSADDGDTLVQPGPRAADESPLPAPSSSSEDTHPSMAWAAATAAHATRGVSEAERPMVTDVSLVGPVPPPAHPRWLLPLAVALTVLAIGLGGVLWMRSRDGVHVEALPAPQDAPAPHDPRATASPARFAEPPPAAPSASSEPRPRRPARAAAEPAPSSRRASTTPPPARARPDDAPPERAAPSPVGDGLLAPDL